MTVALFALFADLALADQPETWTLDFTTDMRFSNSGPYGTVSLHNTIAGQVSLSINSRGALTGQGTMSVTESAKGPNFSSSASGTGKVSVTGKRDGPNLIFRFSGKEFPIRGTMSAAGMSMKHESSFNPEIPAPVDTYIERKGGATTSATHSVGGGKCTSHFTLSGGQNVVKIAPVDTTLYPMTNNMWVLEFDARWTTYGITTTMTGRAEFPLPEKDGPAKGTGALEMRNAAELVKGELILDGWIEDKVLTFTPRGTFQSVTAKAGKGTATSKYGTGLWAFTEPETVTLPVEGDAERVIPFVHALSKSSGQTTWRLKGDKEPKLVELKLSKEAKTTGIVKPKNWAAVKKDSDPVIVTAITDPNTKKAWKKIKWSGDAGEAIAGEPNKRRLSRAASKKYHVVAELGGKTDHADLWILWAEVETLCSKSDTTPPNSPKYKDLYAKLKIFDNTEKLGECHWANNSRGAGKTAHIATLTPKGVNQIVKGGWKFLRQKKGYRWADKVCYPKWPSWTKDHSKPLCVDETPDAEDKIYDIDAPTIGGDSSSNTNEAYIVFRQYVEWDQEQCSDDAFWNFQARWEYLKDPKTVYIDVAKGLITPRQDSYYAKNKATISD